MGGRVAAAVERGRVSFLRFLLPGMAWGGRAADCRPHDKTS